MCLVSLLQCVEMCLVCLLQCVEMCCSSVLQCVQMCCSSVLQCVQMCCSSVLQCVQMCCSSVCKRAVVTFSRVSLHTAPYPPPSAKHSHASASYLKFRWQVFFDHLHRLRLPPAVLTNQHGVSSLRVRRSFLVATAFLIISSDASFRPPPAILTNKHGVSSLRVRV